jgi:DMSO/TMAO reductase YedYZ molybdopterin-dependent catalytic subunit
MYSRMGCNRRVGRCVNELYNLSLQTSTPSLLCDVLFLSVYSYQYTDGTQFYEAIYIELAKHHQTILAYEMNGEQLSVPYGAPLRLRVETQLGYKMVKWIKSVEFVSDYKNIGMGQGGHREDHMYYGIGAGI